MKIKLLAALILLFVVTGTQRVLAQESIIPEINEAYLNKLIETAKTNYPRYKTYGTRIDIAKTDISLARISILDALTISYIYQPDNATVIDPANPSSRTFKGVQAGIFINLGTILRVPVNVRKTKLQLLVAQNDRDEYLLTLTVEIKKRYFTYLQRIAQLKVYSRSVLQTQNGLKDMEYRYKKGEVTYDTYNKGLIELTTQTEQKIDSEAQLFIARAELEELLGDKLENIN